MDQNCYNLIYLNKEKMSLLGKVGSKDMNQLSTFSRVITPEIEIKITLTFWLVLLF